MNQRRLNEIAVLVPWCGAFLLTPPMILIVQNWATATRLPLFHIYLFVCWAVLIFVARRLSLRLAAADLPGQALPPKQQ